MSAAKIVALILWVVAVVVFGLVGLDAISSTHYNLIAGGLAAAWAGMIVFNYVP